MRPSLLHVVTASFNPRRFKSHVKNYTDFERHMLESGVQLTVVECAYGDIPYALDINDQINHVPVYAKTVTWAKERALRIGISRLPRDWKYVAWIDADIIFENPNWAEETVYALQHYDFVQPWEHCMDLDASGGIGELHHSYCRQWLVEPESCVRMGKGGYKYAHSGYAWAATRDALENVGGLIDTALLGAADHHMALALIGKAELSFPGGISEGYKRPILEWQDRANRHINKNIGYVPGTVRHLHHGSKVNRAYISRWEIIKKHQFDPATDLKVNTSGMWELTGSKPELRRDIMAYFAARQEDQVLL